MSDARLSVFPTCEDEWNQLASRLIAPSGAGVILRSKRAGVRTVRWTASDGMSVIAKVYCERGWRAAVRRALRRTGGRREARALRVLSRAGVACARLVAYVRPGRGRPEVVFMEDLGTVRRCVDVLSEMVRAGRADEADALESQIVDITRRMIAAGLGDADHSLMNLVVTESGRVFRIDLELAGELTGSRGRLLVPMIRRLVETHVIACGDAAERARAFQRRIERDILLPAGVTYAATEPGVAASSRGSGLLTSRQAG